MPSVARAPRPPAATAVLQALFVAFLWSTSWVLIKIGLKDIPALTFAGLRYLLAFLVLVPLALRPNTRRRIAGLSGREWVRLTLLGLVMYTVTQGAQFLALSYLPAQTTSLLLSFSPVVVALLSVAVLGEQTRPWQWAGVALTLVGAAVFLYPVHLAGAAATGFLVAGVCLVANAGAALLGRDVNRSARLDPLTVTVVSMGIGSVALLGTGAITQGIPPISGQSWLIIAALAVVNTAFAFTLWNHTLRSLTAVQSSVINNTMMIQIAVLAWVFLGETLGGRQIVGLVLAAAGTLVVQLARARSSPSRQPPAQTSPAQISTRSNDPE